MNYCRPPGGSSQIRSHGVNLRSTSRHQGAVRQLWPADSDPDSRDGIHGPARSGNTAACQDAASSAGNFQESVQLDDGEYHSQLALVSCQWRFFCSVGRISLWLWRSGFVLNRPVRCCVGAVAPNYTCGHLCIVEIANHLKVFARLMQPLVCHSWAVACER